MARFITIEGGEGVGKSVFANGLAAALDAKGVSFIRTFEPGGTPTGTALRELFINPLPNDPLAIETEFCIVSAARAQHVARVIKPALAAGTWVLCDRFADSSRIYQGVLGGIAAEEIESVIRFTTYGLEPDMTFLLDCDVETSMARVENRVLSASETSRFDEGKKDLHEKIRDGFLRLCDQFPQRMVRLDAGQPPETVLSAAMEALQSRYEL